MTYTYKLSYRLAVNNPITKFHLMLVPLLLLSACAGGEIAEPTAIDLARGGIPGGPPKRADDSTLVLLTIAPTVDTLKPAQNRTFIAKGVRKSGDTVTVSASWTATGGQITSTGDYIAGPIPGTFQVIATQEDGTLADTSAVVIANDAPQLTAVVLTPASATVSAGSTQQFAATGQLSDGTMNPVSVTFSATGGTITSDGLYTAGKSGGSFQVVATEVGGTKADTASVTVTTPTASPPPSSPPPLASCDRTVDVSTLSGIKSAIANSLPGDCIIVAPGTYTLGSHLAFTRSGTASAPITIQGAGSSTIINGNALYNIFIDASYIHVRDIRFTNLSSQALWLRGATYNVFDGIEVDHVTHGGIRFRDASHHNTVQNSLFHDTGTIKPYFGEAIYVGNSGSNTNDPVQTTNTDNQILNNHFGPNVRAQAVDVKPGSVRTVIRGNTIDGTGAEWWPTYGSAFLLSIAASDAVVDGNTLSKGNIHGMAFFQQIYPLKGVMVTNNTIDLQNIHNVTDRTPYGFFLAISSPTPSMVTVKCNNAVINGRASNVACTP